MVVEYPWGPSTQMQSIFQQMITILGLDTIYLIFEYFGPLGYLMSDTGVISSTISWSWCRGPGGFQQVIWISSAVADNEPQSPKQPNMAPLQCVYIEIHIYIYIYICAYLYEAPKHALFMYLEPLWKNAIKKALWAGGA